VSAVIILFIYGLLHRDRHLSTRRSQAFCPSGTSRSSSLRTSFRSRMIIALNNNLGLAVGKRIARKRVRAILSFPASERYYEIRERKHSALFQATEVIVACRARMRWLHHHCHCHHNHHHNHHNHHHHCHRLS